MFVVYGVRWPLWCLVRHMLQHLPRLATVSHPHHCLTVFTSPPPLVAATHLPHTDRCWRHYECIVGNKVFFPDSNIISFLFICLFTESEVAACHVYVRRGIV